MILGTPPAITGGASPERRAREFHLKRSIIAHRQREGCNLAPIVRRSVNLRDEPQGSPNVGVRFFISSVAVHGYVVDGVVSHRHHNTIQSLQLQGTVELNSNLEPPTADWRDLGQDYRRQLSMPTVALDRR